MICVAYIYALCEPVSPNAPRYIGSTTKPVEIRYKYHRGHRMKGNHNPELAAWLREVIPVVEVLEVVPDDVRLAREGEVIHRLGKQFQLLNKYFNGFTHSPETRKKISEANRKAWELRRMQVSR